MEQRIGPSSKPLEGAGFDPAFIPGLTSPVAAKPSGETAEEPEDAKPSPEAAASEDGAKPSEEAAVETALDEEASGEEPSGEEEEAPVDGPVFEASDRRASFVADHKGVRLALDDQNCEFRWDEIGAVETETTRFGKRFTITVHTPDRRWYPIEIEAKSRSAFPDWERELDAVLDAYFEDGAQPEQSEETAPEETEPEED
ncbi:hypothetical protein [Streptomyces acidiscabies]|uniref:Uncharacterized protein n=1 Tax=Streptomyces acidiscabies TaxID=42234 RepID=A0AAP6BK24_9ACTN|nr:hypothetical protein [Streptomyces acidiscabies]MBP5937240.1 hypothetical protein [Streptomyces sp. LBUM 1476]MBZ3914704.1 hypothetical protein [Streptomyces acidiscabies]MDX2966143.1 hypothetical protein [Streptomyces acidiscabies]MDX3020618.1 hypothetical protein [Streptomyces acidiscabies]MDX3795825.1 hypothetical protein [Streptomyces acidiscabies]